MQERCEGARLLKHQIPGVGTAVGLGCGTPELSRLPARTLAKLHSEGSIAVGY